jgi:hypothetical protein
MQKIERCCICCLSRFSFGYVFSFFIVYDDIFHRHRKTLGACELFTLGSAAIIWTMGLFLNCMRLLFRGTFLEKYPADWRLYRTDCNVFLRWPTHENLLEKVFMV